MPAVDIEPWVGRKYERPDLFPRKTLLLGESNFTSPQNYTPQLVINCVRDAIDGTDPSGFGRFSTKTIRLIFGERTQHSVEEFWENVAFFNFVGELVGEQARVRPTLEMWSRSGARFERWVSKLQPSQILVLGKATWQNVLRQVSHTAMSAHQAELRLGSGLTMRAGYVNHPSSSVRYSTWHPVARELLL